MVIGSFRTMNLILLEGYRCGTKLQASNPYAHFSTPGMSCYYKLFDGETNPDFDVVEEL